jgi:hypothetical protein
MTKRQASKETGSVLQKAKPHVHRNLKASKNVTEGLVIFVVFILPIVIDILCNK